MNVVWGSRSKASPINYISSVNHLFYSSRHNYTFSLQPFLSERARQTNTTDYNCFFLSLVLELNLKKKQMLEMNCDICCLFTYQFGPGYLVTDWWYSYILYQYIVTGKYRFWMNPILKPVFTCAKILNVPTPFHSMSIVKGA